MRKTSLLSLISSKKHTRHHIVNLREKTVKFFSEITIFVAVLFLTLIFSSCGVLNLDNSGWRNQEAYSPIGSKEDKKKSEGSQEHTVMPVLSPEAVIIPNSEKNAAIQDPGPEPPASFGTGAMPTQYPTPTPQPAGTSEITPTPRPPGTSEITPTPQPDLTPIPTSTTAAPTEVAKPTPEIKPSSTPINTVKMVNPYVPYTYDQMILESRELTEVYPEIITLDNIGNSVEGREITLIKLGKGEKKIILCGSHHAREYITSSYLMKMIEEYSDAYVKNEAFGKYYVREIMDKICIYIIPMVNPDGVNLVNQGLSAVSDQEAVKAMAMLRPTYREWKANINGVDLNRQYPEKWEEKYDEIGKPASESYKGKAPGIEPEIEAMMKLSSENDFVLAASFHTKGNVIYWADRGTVDLIPGVSDMAKRMSSLTKYQRMPVSEDPSIYGAGYENWFRQEFLRPAFCIELTYHNIADKPHDDKNFDSLVWDNAKYIGLFLAQEALER